MSDDQHDPGNAIPELPAYLYGDSLLVWCEHEDTWHTHGSSEGHRVAHCVCRKSPYHERGYVLKQVAVVTERPKGRIANPKCRDGQCRFDRRRGRA